MDHRRTIKEYEKMKTCSSCYDVHCCDTAIKMLEWRAYSNGYTTGYEKAKNNAIKAIVTVSTVIGAVAALLGVILGAFFIADSPTGTNVP